MYSSSRIKFTSLKLHDTFALTLEQNTDERGILTRLWEGNLVFEEFKICEVSIVQNTHSRTLRGLHFQDEPRAESKVIQCLSGKVFDVVVDLRQDSATYKEYLALEIGLECHYQGLFIPKGCAHGYLTLEENTTLLYFMNEIYSPEHSNGIRWDDPL